VKTLVLAVVALLLLFPVPCRADATPVARGGSAIYPGLEVNLGGGNGLRRLFLAFEARCTDEKGAELAVSPRAKEAVIMLLRNKTVEELSTAKGKMMLKEDLLQTLNMVIGSPRVIQILLRQFVIL
jgi:flagellar FliL protein